MLRVEIHDSVDTLSLKLQGRFAGDHAENSRILLTQHCRNGMKVVVDLTDVTFIDSAGEEVLSFFGGFGAKFVADTSYSLDVCERLHLPLARSGGSHANTLGTSATNSGQSCPDAPEPLKKGL